MTPDYSYSRETGNDPLAELRQSQAVARNQRSISLRDDTAYVEGLVDQIEELERQIEFLRSRLPADTWYHTKTAIWRAVTPDEAMRQKIKPKLPELLVRRLHTGLIITRRPEVFDFLLRSTHPTPAHLQDFHGEDAT